MAVVSPEYLPLLTIGPEVPLSDRSPFNLGNARALNVMSAQLKCLEMIPSLMLDFAALTDSGHRVYGGGANVDIQPGLFLVPLFTHFNFFHAKIALAGEGGRPILEDRVSVGQAGQLVQIGSFNNNARSRNRIPVSAATCGGPSRMWRPRHARRSATTIRPTSTGSIPACSRMR